MKPVEEIKYPIQKEMERFEEKFKDSMLSKVPLLNRITYYIVRRKGKQMRPMFVFLVAKMVSDGGFDQRTYRGASIVELIHTASLVHDDIVDDSNRRRGFFSINALWKNKIAVLVGDFLFAKGLLLSIDNEDFDLLKLISIAVREISEGELLQIEKARKLNITEDVYYGGSLYSSEEASASPNGLRIYGNWVFNDPETGVEVSYKWMGVAQFNEDGKIHNFADWFDVSSIPSQIAGTYQR